VYHDGWCSVVFVYSRSDVPLFVGVPRTQARLVQTKPTRLSNSRPGNGNTNFG
jgi:hypothetical protein